MGTPILILSGGDPVNRPDLLDLVRHGKSRGLRMATIPAATDCLTRELVQSLKGVGPRPDGGEPRLPAGRAARRLPRRAGRLREDDAGGGVGARGGPAPAGEHHGLRRHRALPRGDGRTSSRGSGSSSGRCSSSCRWGGGASSPGSPRSECERLFEVIYRVQKKEGFVVKVTEAPHYRRHVAQREMKDGGHPSARPDGPGRDARPAHAVGGSRPHRRSRPSRRELGQRLPVRLAPRRDHAERLPADPGRQRARDGDRPTPTASLRSFEQLRTPSSYKGRCGRCEFRDICGGSRSRAYGLTGDPFETDPWCSYEPLGGAASHTPPVARAGVRS